MDIVAILHEWRNEKHLCHLNVKEIRFFQKIGFLSDLDIVAPLHEWQNEKHLCHFERSQKSFRAIMVYALSLKFFKSITYKNLFIEYHYFNCQLPISA
jgi:hypothetical protein